MGVKETLDEFEGAAVIPMQFVAPMPRFLFEQWLNLADGGLSQIDDIHGCAESDAPLPREHYHSRFVAGEWPLACGR